MTRIEDGRKYNRMETKREWKKQGTIANKMGLNEGNWRRPTFSNEDGLMDDDNTCILYTAL